MARDRRVTRQLRQRGWKVLRIWEHALKKSPQTCIARVRRALLMADGEGRMANGEGRMAEGGDLKG